MPLPFDTEGIAQLAIITSKLAIQLASSTELPEFAASCPLHPRSQTEILLQLDERRCNPRSRGLPVTPTHHPGGKHIRKHIRSRQKSARIRVIIWHSTTGIKTCSESELSKLPRRQFETISIIRNSLSNIHEKACGSSGPRKHLRLLSSKIPACNTTCTRARPEMYLFAAMSIQYSILRVQHRTSIISPSDRTHADSQGRTSKSSPAQDNNMNRNREIQWDTRDTMRDNEIQLRYKRYNEIQ